MDSQWNDKIFTVSHAGFEGLALEIFRFQYSGNRIYNEYCDALGIMPGKVNLVRDIPFLPIAFFKTHQVCTTPFTPTEVFESSGTTGTKSSRHYIKDAAIYEASFIKGFELAYGPVTDLVILGLLPSYLERSNSSLVYMVNRLIELSGHSSSGFYLDNLEGLAQTLTMLEGKKQKTLLIGVTFALLDFAAAYPMELRHTMIMETGGMKGRRKEMVRQEVQDLLRSAFRLEAVHSEYGMTELLSQAYSKKEGLFQCPPWMEVMLRDEEDPRNITRAVKKTGPHVMQVSSVAGAAGDGERTAFKPLSGAINVIDLANVYSCSFIATDDAARLYPNGQFEVLGRLDNSDLRGCSLLTL